MREKKKNENLRKRNIKLSFHGKKNKSRKVYTVYTVSYTYICMHLYLYPYFRQL